MTRVNEAEATVAVDAAARKAYEIARSVSPPSVQFPTWEQIGPLAQNQYREVVLPFVWAALEALPDRSRGLWLEGYYAHESGVREEACPYPLV